MDPTQYVVAAFFYAVIGLLGVVTLGMLYINISQWRDNIQEKEDKLGKKGKKEESSSLFTKAPATG